MKPSERIMQIVGGVLICGLGLGLLGLLFLGIHLRFQIEDSHPGMIIGHKGTTIKPTIDLLSYNLTVYSVKVGEFSSDRKGSRPSRLFGFREPNPQFYSLRDPWGKECLLCQQISRMLFRVSVPSKVEIAVAQSNRIVRRIKKIDHDPDFGSSLFLNSPISEIDPLSKRRFHEGRLPFHYASLPLHNLGLISDLAKSKNRRYYASESDKNQGSSRPSAKLCEVERPSLHLASTLFFGVGLGSLCIALVMAFCVNYNRPILAAALIGPFIGIAAASPIWWFNYCFLYPYTWGLPPHWLPNKWNPCKQEQRSQHRLVHIGTGALTRDLVWCDCGRGLSLSGKWTFCPNCGSRIDPESYHAAVEQANKNGALPYQYLDRDTAMKCQEIIQAIVKLCDDPNKESFAIAFSSDWGGNSITIEIPEKGHTHVGGIHDGATFEDLVTDLHRQLIIGAGLSWVKS